MANALTEFELLALHDAIAADIKAQFPALQTVMFYRDDTDREPITPAELPAVLLELVEWDTSDADDPGTEQLAVNARFDAYIVMKSSPTGKASAWILAGALCAWLRDRRFLAPGNTGKAIPTGPAKVIGAYTDHFRPELDQYTVRRVEWHQVLHLGQTVWKDSGVTPRVFFGFAPEVGVPYKDDYIELLNNGPLG